MDSNKLSGRFGRKIFFSFILAAIIPATLLTLLSIRYVTGQLTAQHTRALQATAKEAGMRFIEDLERQKKTLTEIAAGLSVANNRSSLKAVIATLPEGELKSLIHIQTSRKLAKGLIGQTTLPRMPLEAIRKQLETLPALLFVEAQRLLLAVPTGTTSDSADELLIAELNPAALFPMADQLPTEVEACLLHEGTVIHCVHSEGMQSIQPRHSGSTDNKDTLLAQWPIFLGGQFTHDQWSSEVYQDKAIALAPAQKFYRLLPPVMLLAVLIVIYLTNVFLRNTLKPLKLLHSAAQQVSDGQLDTQVNIDTGDEFSQLGSTFNQMAESLQTQFQRMQVMADIDRMILSTLDTKSIVNTILKRTTDIVDCRQVAVLLFDDEEGRHGSLYMSSSAHGADTEEQKVILPTRIRLDLEIEETHSLILPDTDAWLKKTGFPEQAGITLAWHAIPIENLQRTFGVLWFGFDDTAQPSAEDLEQLRSYADRITVAVGNANWEKRLFRQAHYDTLTGLPNRQLLNDRLDLSINRARRQDNCVAVLFVDLDDFKTVNDTFGHSAGDQLLKVLASRLQHSLRNVDMVVRFGGDEFIIIISDIDQAPAQSYLQPVIKKIQETIAEPVNIRNHALQPTASIGVAFFPDDADTGQALIQHADAAMYEAKNRGRGHAEFFSKEHHASLIKRLNLEEGLRDAISENQLELYYQPQVDCRSGKILAAEALVRWHHPEYGFIQPDDFIALAEDTGMITPLGEWVIRTACRQNARWQQQGLPPIRVAVNISARQFSDGDLVAVIQESLLSNQLDADYLEIEITEQGVMNDVIQTLNVLRRIQAIGVQTAIDDFGTGYSSLSYLQQFPINTLKIDRSFTREITRSRDGKEIVSAIITLAHALHLQIVAEGVETLQEQTILQALDCELLQGYLYSKPLTAGNFTKLLMKSGDADQNRHEQAGKEAITV